MTHVVGLTGSIGMGKSTTAKMFAEAGVPIWDADAAVHELYAPGGAAVSPISKVFPTATRDGHVDRAELKRLMAEDHSVLPRIEAIVHPLVAAHRQAFFKATEADIVLLDIPLLFETGADAQMDSTICVSAPAEIQRARVLARPGMTAPLFETILAQQMPDTAKRSRADYVIETLSLDHARAQVAAVLADIRRKLAHA